MHTVALVPHCKKVLTILQCGPNIWNMQRLQTQIIGHDLKKKMVFVTGPRQVGKTTLAKALESDYPKIQYLNYDHENDRDLIVSQNWDRKVDLVILDEVHKLKKWKSKLKGVFDTEGNNPKILVTGSARLDVYRRGGDSLAGRYYQHRLYPLSVKELLSLEAPEKSMKNLMRFGGFPEPYFSQSEDETARWRKQHIERIIREDVQDLEPVKDIQTLLLLIDMLRLRVGSTVSYNSMARDLEISPHTVKRWVSVLCNMYVIFVVSPYSKNIGRSLLKEPKIYFYDTSSVKGDAGAKFENMVAVSLLKSLHYLEDTKGMDVSLNYLRDKEKHEVDFAVIKDGKLDSLIECKWSDSSLATSLKYFSDRLKPKQAVQLVAEARNNKSYGNIQLVKAHEWLAELAI